MYGIRTDIGAGVIDIAVTGTWTEADLAGFADALAKAAAAIDATGRSHVVLCDYDFADAQPPGIVAGLKTLVANRPRSARKLALHATDPFARARAQRVLGWRDDAAVFADRASALEWLLGDQLDRYIRAG